jgi:hypothetical protein
LSQQGAFSLKRLDAPLVMIALGLQLKDALPDQLQLSRQPRPFVLKRLCAVQG